MLLNSTSTDFLKASMHGDLTEGSLFQCPIGQPIAMPHNSFSEEISPNIQHKPPLVQLEAISAYPITWCAGEKPSPHLVIDSFKVTVKYNNVSPEPFFLQAKQPQIPQPFLIRFVL